MLDDYFAGRYEWDTSLDRAARERLDALVAMYGIARVDSRWRGRFSPVLIGDIVAEFRTNDLREWMTMTEEQRLDWMARALRDRRAASSEPAPSRMPRTALPLLGWRASLVRVTPAGREFTRWFLYVPPGATT